jgi:hypothetical protein
VADPGWPMSELRRPQTLRQPASKSASQSVRQSVSESVSQSVRSLAATGGKGPRRAQVGDWLPRWRLSRWERARERGERAEGGDSDRRADRRCLRSGHKAHGWQALRPSDAFSKLEHGRPASGAAWGRRSPKALCAQGTRRSPGPRATLGPPRCLGSPSASDAWRLPARSAARAISLCPRGA